MLRKTTILPTDDPELAREMLRHLIHEEPHVLLIVLGTGDEAMTFAERADKLAGAPEEPRWIAWARDPEAVKEVIDELRFTKSLAGKKAEAIGFALSLTDVVREVFVGSEAPDLFAIYSAFKKAERDRDE